MNCPVLEIVSEESVKSPIVATLCTSKSSDLIVPSTSRSY